MNTEVYATTLFLAILTVFTLAGFLGLPIWGL